MSTDGHGLASCMWPALCAERQGLEDDTQTRDDHEDTKTTKVS
jgi:hypothetical protein